MTMSEVNDGDDQFLAELAQEHQIGALYREAREMVDVRFRRPSRLGNGLCEVELGSLRRTVIAQVDCHLTWVVASVYEDGSVESQMTERRGVVLAKIVEVFGRKR